MSPGGSYDFHARHGVEFAKVLIDQTRSGRRNYKPFLHGIARAQPRGRVGRLRDENAALKDEPAIAYGQQRATR